MTLGAAAAVPTARGRAVAVAAALGFLALALRVAFWRATPDAAWPGTAWYAGDARLWLDWAAALAAGRLHEGGLPIRPPGAAYLIAALTSGDPAARIGWLKLVWCVLGAGTVSLAYLAVRRSFGATVALAVGAWCAVSTGLLVLSTSLDNETPYLAVVAATVLLWASLERRPRGTVLAAWAALNAVACLVRVEHALCFALTLGWLASRWAREAASRDARARRAGVAGRLALVGLVFGAVLAPWHLAAWRAIARFNDDPSAVDASTQAAHAQVEHALTGLSWQPEAIAALGELPAAARSTARAFVGATAFVRGERTVGAGALDVLEEAFGAVPRRLPRRPFVALYGGLNFHLANHAGATGGFARGPLDDPPPLAGGRERYPLVLLAGLPPARLTLTYPPHLAAVTDGYALGLRWIAAHPSDFLDLVVRKLAIAWSGVALGVGGRGAPWGLGGVRRPVDLVVPDGTPAFVAWQLVLLGLAFAGAWRVRGRAAAVPWVAFLATKLVVTVAFFGYARQGASAVPAVALLACIALGAPCGIPATARDGATSRRLARALGGALVVVAGVELVRWADPPVVRLDGREITASPPSETGAVRAVRVEVGSRDG